MSPPVRGLVHVTLHHGFADPGTMKIRDLVEWYKKIVRLADTIGTPTAMEQKEIEQAYGYVVGVVATAQQVPVVWLMAGVQDLARSEMMREELDDEPQA